jgi:glutathione S-transferase
MNTRLFHLALPEDWEAATESGEYGFSTRGLSYHDVGFVHCSYEHQLMGVANLFYADCEELVILQLDPSLLGAALIDEPAPDNPTEMFPHLYGPLPLAAVREAVTWSANSTGGFSDPQI